MSATKKNKWSLARLFGLTVCLVLVLYPLTQFSRWNDSFGQLKDYSTFDTVVLGVVPLLIAFLVMEGLIRKFDNLYIQKNTLQWAGALIVLPIIVITALNIGLAKMAGLGLDYWLLGEKIYSFAVIMCAITHFCNWVLPEKWSKSMFS